MEERHIEPLKFNAIIEEVNASFNFIVTALKILKEQNSIVSNNHVPLQLFASGFERVLKILILIKDKHETGKFPELTRAKDRFKAYSNGHGIEKMLAEIINYSDKVDSFKKNQMLVEDINFLKSDAQFKKFILIITEFSIQQRYYYIDTVVLDQENTNFNPFEEFKKLIWSFDESINIEEQDYQEEESIKLLNTIKCIEKGVRAISRFFSQGFEDLGRRYNYEFSNFLILKDENLGKLKYSEKKTPTSESYKPISTLSPVFLMIRLNSRSKKLKSISFFEEWAFKTDDVTVYWYKEDFYFVEIEKKLYALTGKTSTKFKIPNYYKSESLKPRMVATYLLDEAKKLNEK